MEFKFTRVQPIIENDKVTKWVIGMTGSKDGEVAYIETIKIIDEEQQKSLDQWSQSEIRKMCLEVASENNWYEKLSEEIEARRNRPSIKVGPNFTV